MDLNPHSSDDADTRSRKAGIYTNGLNHYRWAYAETKTGVLGRLIRFYMGVGSRFFAKFHPGDFCNDGSEGFLFELPQFLLRNGRFIGFGKLLNQLIENETGIGLITEFMKCKPLF